MSRIVKQLKIAIEHMENTPTIISHHDALWWTGGMPGYPDEYKRDDWDLENEPIYVVWEEYLYDLDKEISELEEDNSYGIAQLKAHLEKARALPIADLIEEGGE